jgi:hypothetical protein
LFYSFLLTITIKVPFKEKERMVSAKDIYDAAKEGD